MLKSQLFRSITDSCLTPLGGRHDPLLGVMTAGLYSNTFISQDNGSRTGISEGLYHPEGVPVLGVRGKMPVLDGPVIELELGGRRPPGPGVFLPHPADVLLDRLLAEAH